MFTAFLTLAAAAVATPASLPADKPHDYANGWEQAYRLTCSISDEERARWASRPERRIVDLGEYLAGFDAAIDEAAEYEADGFDGLEWCGDVHP